MSNKSIDGMVTSSEVYRNEFAMVHVSRVETDNGVVMRIQDAASQHAVYLDAIELEALARLRHDDFAPLLDPGNHTSEGEPDPDQV